MRKEAKCNLCLMGDERQVVVAVYWNGQGEEKCCCAEHLGIVRQVRLDYRMLEAEKEVE